MLDVKAAWVVLGLVVAITLVWRWASWPCPAWLVPLLENPYVEAMAGAKTILARAGIRPGMRVLDAGCGPGRLTVPASMMVGPSGQIVAVDIQRRMLQMLRGRVQEKGLTNVELVLAGLGEGKLAANKFDIALLVTVLGEIPDKLAALREIYQCLQPGGILSITEVLPDPHYQGLSRVRRLVAESGFRELAIFQGCLSYTLNVSKPAPVPHKL
ncbi:MAG: methyltransferase domain-containing protein [Terrimicrobiaceae bacterium]